MNHDTNVQVSKSKSESKITLPGGILKNKFFVPFLLVILLQLLVMLGIFSRPEMALYDSWFRLRGYQNPGEQVVVIAIDETSIEKIGPPSWPRTVHAELLKKLEPAKVVAFDMTFGAEKDPVEDQLFAEAITEHGGVILASKFSFETDENGEVIQVFEPPLMSLMQGAAGLGFVNTPTDPDQVVRRITTVDVNTFEGVPFPSLGLAAALEAEDLSPLDLELTPQYLKCGEKQIPLGKDNKALPKFWGPSQTFKTISYADVIRSEIPASYFKDKIVLVGSTTQEEHDTYPTPFTTSNMVKSGAPPTPGVEIHAAVVNSFMNNTWYKEVGPIINFLFLLIVIILTALAVVGRGPLRGFIGTLVMLVLTTVTVYLFWNARLWLNFAAPLLAIILTYTGVTAWDFIVAEMGRRKTRATFSRYVSPEVVDELMNNPDDISLGGKKQVVTIMFADIRGFTAYSENKDPEDVIARLNEYLTVMTESIFKHGGTLDKYLGDGLMAFFGAPVYYEDHVERAVTTAIEIQEEVEKLNHKWALEGAVPLKVAVGINTGPAVVGNVGSPERMDYTLIGEDVNLASRVEALSKLFETLIVVSDRSYNLLPVGELKDSLYLLGAELVKGFTEPISCYSIKGLDLHFEKSTDKGFK